LTSLEAAAWVEHSCAVGPPRSLGVVLALFPQNDATVAGCSRSVRTLIAPYAVCSTAMNRAAATTLTQGARDLVPVCVEQASKHHRLAFEWTSMPRYLTVSSTRVEHAPARPGLDPSSICSRPSPHYRGPVPARCGGGRPCPLSVPATGLNAAPPANHSWPRFVLS
jgi:hypothetical protein